MEIMSSNSSLTTTTRKMSMAVQAYCSGKILEKNYSNNNNNSQNLGMQSGGKKKGRRTPRVSKNREEVETQRMTPIAVERNRQKQMDEHLAVLPSRMSESYVQRISIAYATDDTPPKASTNDKSPPSDLGSSNRQ
ncbi:hypothetical protein L2E82_22484 [Cichorium intybus]|uniref:Uncharacterized protein n=1 Tax=Cichorium intybus TaxID=13427 RepID=A0ACB9DYI8_CICIN|nr:hypothetical protein L2E82_22484 [Cichorium intybus]